MEPLTLVFVHLCEGLDSLRRMNKGEDGSTEVPSVRMRHTDAHNDEHPSPTSFHSDVKCPSFTQKERSDVTLISYVTVAGQPIGDSAKVRFYV